MTSTPVNPALHGLLNRYSLDGSPDQADELGVAVSARNYFLASVAERRCEVSSFNSMLDIYYDDGGGKEDELPSMLTTPPRYGRAVHRNSLGSAKSRRPPTPLVLSSTSCADSPSSRSAASKGKIFKDGQLLRITPPRYSRRSQSLGMGSSEKRDSLLISRSGNSPSDRSAGRSQEKVWPAANRGRAGGLFSSSPDRSSASKSKAKTAELPTPHSNPRLRRVEFLRSQNSYMPTSNKSLLTPPRKMVTGNSFGTTIPETLDLDPAPSISTANSLELVCSTSSELDGPECSDDTCAAASALSLATAVCETRPLTKAVCLRGHRSDFVSSIESKVGRLSMKQENTIDNLEDIKSNSLIQNKVDPDDESTATTAASTDAPSLLSGFTARNVESKQDAICLLSNVISLLAGDDNGMSSGLQEIESLEKLGIQNSIGDKNNTQEDATEPGGIGRKVKTRWKTPMCRDVAEQATIVTAKRTNNRLSLQGISTPRASHFGRTIHSSTVTPPRVNTPTSSLASRWRSTPRSSRTYGSAPESTSLSTATSVAGKKATKQVPGMTFRTPRARSTPRAMMRYGSTPDATLASEATKTSRATPLANSRFGMSATPCAMMRYGSTPDSTLASEATKTSRATPLMKSEEQATPRARKNVATPVSNIAIRRRSTPLSLRLGDAIDSSKVSQSSGKATPTVSKHATTPVLNKIPRGMLTPRALRLGATAGSKTSSKDMRETTFVATKTASIAVKNLTLPVSNSIRFGSDSTSQGFADVSLPTTVSSHNKPPSIHPSSTRSCSVCKPSTLKEHPRKLPPLPKQKLTLIPILKEEASDDPKLRKLESKLIPKKKSNDERKPDPNSTTKRAERRKKRSLSRSPPCPATPTPCSRPHATQAKASSDALPGITPTKLNTNNRSTNNTACGRTQHQSPLMAKISQRRRSTSRARD